MYMKYIGWIVVEMDLIIRVSCIVVSWVGSCVEEEVRKPPDCRCSIEQRCRWSLHEDMDR